VTAFNCTKTGIERGSDADSRQRRAKVKSGAIEACVLISDLSWSSTARHSTRTAETDGVRNSSAVRSAVPAENKEKAASKRETNLVTPLAKASPPTAGIPHCLV
jgi:hypothetical protein